MKKRFFKTKLVVVLLVLTLTLSACSKGSDTVEEPENAETPGVEGAADLEPQHFKIAHEETPEGDQHYYCTTFAEYLEEATDGKYTCDVYTAGQLGDTVSQTELVQNGTIAIGFNCNGPLAALVEEANILNLHYVMPTEMADYQDLLHNGEGIKLLEEVLYEKNLNVIDWAHSGYSYWTANKELRTPEDWKGTKFRVMPTPVIMKAFEAYGANATPVAYTEPYSSLQLNMVDGQTNPLTCIKDMKFYEVQDYIMDAKAEYMAYAFMMNTDVWENLPEEGQEIVSEIAKKVNVEYNEFITKKYADLIDFFVDEGLEYVELTPEEIDTFRELSMPIREEYVETCGPKAEEILGLILEDAKKYE